MSGVVVFTTGSELGGETVVDEASEAGGALGGGEVAGDEGAGTGGELGGGEGAEGVAGKTGGELGGGEGVVPLGDDAGGVSSKERAASPAHKASTPTARRLYGLRFIEPASVRLFCEEEGGVFFIRRWSKGQPNLGYVKSVSYSKTGSGVQ